MFVAVRICAARKTPNPFGFQVICDEKLIKPLTYSDLSPTDRVKKYETFSITTGEKQEEGFCSAVPVILIKEGKCPSGPRGTENIHSDR